MAGCPVQEGCQTLILAFKEEFKMAKATDRLADVEQTFDERNETAKRLEKVETVLEEKRSRIRQILGMGDVGFSLGALSFSQPMVIVGAAALSFVAGAMLVSPVAGIVVAGVGAVAVIAWFRR